MIENIEQLIQAIEQMGRCQRILESYRRDILPMNVRNFLVFAQGPLEQMRQLQAQVDAYLQRNTSPELAKAGE
jgi:hypothetical protein